MQSQESSQSSPQSNAADELNGEEKFSKPPEPIVPKDKSTMTREEREANYEAVRARIFKDYNPADGTPTSTSRSTSQASSVNGERNPRANLKKRPVDTDPFEARSQFTTAFYPQHMPGYNAGQQGPFNGYVHQGMGEVYVPTADYLGAQPQNPMANMMNPYMQRYAGPPFQDPTYFQTSSHPAGHAPYVGNMGQAPLMPAQDVSKLTNAIYPSFGPYNGANGTQGYLPGAPNSQHWNGPQIPHQNHAQLSSGLGYPQWNRQVMDGSAGVRQQYNYAQPQRGNDPSLSYQHHGNNRQGLNPQTQSFIPGGNGVQDFGPSWQTPAGLDITSDQPARNKGVSVPRSLPNHNKAGNSDSIAKWGTPSHLPPKPLHAAVYRYDVKAGLTAVSLEDAGTSSGVPLAKSELQTEEKV
jgi:hypothetical protein